MFSSRSSTLKNDINNYKFLDGDTVSGGRYTAMFSVFQSRITNEVGGSL